MTSARSLLAGEYYKLAGEESKRGTSFWIGQLSRIIHVQAALLSSGASRRHNKCAMEGCNGAYLASP